MPYKRKTSKEWKQGAGSEFKVTKRFGPISVGHRQWRDKGHCRFAHGYGRYIEFTFACEELDEKGWVMDFGGLKSIKNEDELNSELTSIIENASKRNQMGSLNKEFIDLNKGAIQKITNYLK